MEELLELTEILNNLAQPIAVLGAGVYFFYRWNTGWIYSNLSLSTSSKRQSSKKHANLDSVTITINMEKGSRENARLESIEVTGFNVDGPENVISSQSPDIKHPKAQSNLNLPPDEKASFEVHFYVPKSDTIIFQTTVIACASPNKASPIWKTSIVSTPISSEPPSA